jgi:dihydrofolate synthase/folylpolyglutamate synthase
MFGLPKSGDGLAIDRILRFYAAHNIDTERLSRRSIVITGSNGKGSTARFAQAALESRGFRVGCFTSPHLFDVRERFLIGEAMIPQAEFDAHAAAVLAFNATLSPGDRMGAFEALFLMAILWFEREAPDAIVWEAGIGGRYDPVRTVRAEISCLTSVELEHTQILGATEELIAFDKSDALAPGGILILSPGIEPDLRRRVAAYARLSDKHVRTAANHAADTRNTSEGVAFAWRGQPQRLSLIGRHQVDNAVTGLRAAQAWLGAGADDEPPQPMLDALARVRWPGRLERVANSPDLWIDVGHTPRAVDAVTEAFLDIVPREKTLVVFGVSAGKEVGAIARIVAERFDNFILTRAHKAGADASTFRAAFKRKGAIEAPDTETAARLARERATREGLTVLALGGLFLSVEVEHAWKGGDPTELDFF